MHFLSSRRWIGVWVTAAALAAWAPGAAGDAFVRHGKSFLVGPNPNAIAAVDLNDDRLIDIVTANTGSMGDPRQERPANDEVSVLIAASDLEYAPLPPLRTDFAPYAIAIGNVDTMKAPEIMVASFMSVHHQDVSLFRNVGDNLFEPFYFRVPEELLPYNRMRDGDQEAVFTRPGLTSLQLADFNQDGFRDLIGTGWSSDVLVFFPGAASGYFAEPRLTVAAEGPRDVRVADFDNDKNLDLAVVLYSSGELGFWKGDGAGAFLPMNRFATRGRLPVKAQVADINCDGRLDVVVAHCYTDDSIVIFYGDGDFSFSNSQEILLGADRTMLEHEIRDLLVTDLNADGRPDIVAAAFGSKQLHIQLNQSGDEVLPQRFHGEMYTIEEGKPRALCTHDFNRDGAADIAAALWGSNTVTFFLGKAPEKPKSDKSDKSDKKSDDKSDKKSDKKKKTPPPEDDEEDADDEDADDETNPDPEGGRLPPLPE